MIIFLGRSTKSRVTTALLLSYMCLGIQLVVKWNMLQKLRNWFGQNETRCWLVLKMSNGTISS